MNRIFKVYWFPNVPFDCEKHCSYVLAKNAQDAMDYMDRKGIIVCHSEEVINEEKDEALKWHWCVNDNPK